MTVTNTDEDGIHGLGIRMINAKVELFDVALKGCGSAGLFIPSSTTETTVVATRCEFSNNRHGAAVFGSLSSAKFNNCVFHDNSSDINYTIQQLADLILPFSFFTCFTICLSR